MVVVFYDWGKDINPPVTTFESLDYKACRDTVEKEGTRNQYILHLHWISVHIHTKKVVLEFPEETECIFTLVYIWSE